MEPRLCGALRCDVSEITSCAVVAEGHLNALVGWSGHPSPLLSFRSTSKCLNLVTLEVILEMVR
jgi:hypothetical protein